MSIELHKGDSITIEKPDGSAVKQLCVGVNWGAIQSKGLFGRQKRVGVDLDASCITYNANKEVVELVYYGKLSVPGIKHSGDDIVGDTDGDDGLDNEVIMLNMPEVNSEAEQIVFVLNSFQNHDFKDIPFASIRLYEGTPTQVDNELASYDIANDPQFAGSTSLVLGKMTRQESDWSFKAIGEITNDEKLESTAKTVKREYL